MAQSEAYEYRYTSDGAAPVFVPTHPGTYTIALSADLAQGDPLFPGVAHAESSVEVQVDGPVTASGGCNAGGRGASDGVLLAGLMMLAGLVVRRRTSK